MRIIEETLKLGITRTIEFEKKWLCSFGVNTGLICGHACTYCSTGTMVRTHEIFKKLGLNPFEKAYAIVDPETPTRVARDARRKRKRGLVQLCTIVDAWSPEAQKYDLGRRCLEAILSQPGWTIRILTKNAAVRKDFDLIEKHKDRVLLSLSITATPDKGDIMSVVEPYASPNHDRIAVLREAYERGLRTYGMLCPLLPAIADSAYQIEELVDVAVAYRAEEIFVEPVNPRGRGLILTQEALEDNGYYNEAAAIKSIRNEKNWSHYVLHLVDSAQGAVRKRHRTDKLRFLLYPDNLLPEHVTQIIKNDAGVIWLHKDRRAKFEQV